MDIKILPGGGGGGGGWGVRRIQEEEDISGDGQHYKYA